MKLSFLVLIFSTPSTETGITLATDETDSTTDGDGTQDVQITKSAAVIATANAVKTSNLATTIVTNAAVKNAPSSTVTQTNAAVTILNVVTTTSIAAIVLTTASSLVDTPPISTTPTNMSISTNLPISTTNTNMPISNNAPTTTPISNNAPISNTPISTAAPISTTPPITLAPISTDAPATTPISTAATTTLTAISTAAPTTTAPISTVTSTIATTTTTATTTTPTSTTTALVLDAQGDITSETISGNFILKCGKQVNTTAYYHSKPNVANFNNTEMVCCSVCAITAGKSSSGKRKRAAPTECLTDFQNVYLENVNGLVNVEFSVAGERGDCAFLAGSNVTISWKPITFCSPTVKFYGSNDTACSVVNSWISCGNNIQNQKLPADPYCKLSGPVTCGQPATYQCTTSNSATVFQSVTQGLALERVQDWAYFWSKDYAAWSDFATAYSYCQSKMMDLAFFDTMAELDAVLLWYQAGATQYNGTNRVHTWIGINHVADPTIFVINKTGAQTLVLKFVAGEPSNGPEQCVALIANHPSPGQSGMEDLNCWLVTQFICKVPPQFVWTVKMP